MKFENYSRNRNKIQYQNNRFLTKLELKIIKDTAPTIAAVKRKVKKLKSERELRAHSLNIDNIGLQHKMIDTENLIERLKEESKYAASNIKNINAK